ncbi:MAG: LysM peptidoglycan-binding domain-containing protein [Lysinibacillus sp.]
MLNKKVLALATASTLSTGAFVATSTESLWSVAQKYDVQIDKLKNNNHLESHSVFPNEQLEISSNKQGNNIYVVQPGDSLYVISKEYGITVDQLAELNEIDAPYLIYPGDKIAVDEAAAALKQASTQTEDDALTLTMTATAYTAYCEGCSGITKNGTDIRANPHLKVIAVDPTVIPLGTRVWVEGYGEAIAADIGGAIKGNIIDVFIPSHEEALEWGRKTVKVRILE